MKDTQAMRSVLRGDGKRYESVYDAAWDVWLNSYATSYKGAVYEIVAAANGKLGAKTRYGYEWRWADDGNDWQC